MSNLQLAAEEYEKKIHRTGRISSICALLIVLAVPALVCLQFDIFPPMNSIFSGLFTISMVFLPVSLAEVLAYTPMLGSGASYLAFVSGNLTNLKIPCAVMSMEVAGVKPSTKEGDIISTIAVAVSTMVTTVIIIVGMIAIVPLTPLLSAPALAPAFDNILPALFGGLGVYWMIKQWKLALAPLIVAVAVTPFIEVNVAALVPFLAIISIAAARVMYNKGWLTEKAE